MKTEIDYYDENNNLINGDLVFSLKYKNKNYVILDVNNDNSLEVREYDELKGIHVLYKVDDSTLVHIKKYLEQLCSQI